MHVKLVYGEEPHHVVEAIFKCFARALDVATQIEPRAADQLPTHQGEAVGRRLLQSSEFRVRRGDPAPTLAKGDAEP